MISLFIYSDAKLRIFLCVSAFFELKSLKTDTSIDKSQGYMFDK